jgi:hypothetical protein
MKVKDVPVRLGYFMFDVSPFDLLERLSIGEVLALRLMGTDDEDFPAGGGPKGYDDLCADGLADEVEELLESLTALGRSDDFEVIVVEDGSAVPFLAGEAGNDDGFVPTAFAQGDANGDGAVDVADVVETVNQIQGSPSSRFIFDAADMNKDRDVNADDVIQIVNAIMSSK